MLLFTSSTQHQSLRKTPWTCWRDICQNWASRRTPKTVRRRPASAELIWFESYCPLINTTTDKQDVDIWEEPEEGNVIRDGDNITGGTLNKLVEKLTAEKTPGWLVTVLARAILCAHSVVPTDPTSTKTFLMTYQSFTTPRKLLEKLFQRYEVPLNRYKGDDNMRYTRPRPTTHYNHN